ncbi:MAG: elongation factor P maturation arginine rhamnosyltransferase EarP, partial [Methylophilaceae bacterium]
MRFVISKLTIKPKRWDIFCKILDNFGDIGVCWRLARQLTREHGLQVRLFVDDMHVAKQLIPTLEVTQQTQIVDSITSKLWQADRQFNDVSEGVIEAFSCV